MKTTIEEKLYNIYRGFLDCFQTLRYVIVVKLLRRPTFTEEEYDRLGVLLGFNIPPITNEEQESYKKFETEYLSLLDSSDFKEMMTRLRTLKYATIDNHGKEVYNKYWWTVYEVIQQ